MRRNGRDGTTRTKGDDATAAFEVVLRSVGVHRGDPTRRRIFAQQFVGKAPSQQQADMLWYEYAVVRACRNPGALIAQVIESGEWRELIRDLEHEASHRSAAGVRGPTSNSGAWLRKADEEHRETTNEEWSDYLAGRGRLADLDRQAGLPVLDRRVPCEHCGSQFCFKRDDTGAWMCKRTGLPVISRVVDTGRGGT